MLDTDLLGNPIADERIIRTAQISECGKYRYQLTRQWARGDLLPFVMLNPSTADSFFDDPTIRRCMGFARRENMAGIIVVNLYAFRAAKPADMKRATDPFGPENAATLRHVALAAKSPIICAWGVHGREMGGEAVAMNIIRLTGAKTVCLGRTQDGSPQHPLYVKADRSFIPYP